MKNTKFFIRNIDHYYWRQYQQTKIGQFAV